MELRPLQRPGALRRRADLDRRSRGRCSLALCVAAGARQAATILATDDVEDAWFLRFILQATRPRQPFRSAGIRQFREPDGEGSLNRNKQIIRICARIL